ncbi:MAG: DUF3015 family protein [Pseudomonadales bacterium]|nr:DUF3015 family protein [Pseudomonadales bacterium]
MIKKTLLAAAIAILPATSFASGPGCGLGGVLFEGQSGLGVHLMGASTNAPYMTLGMTSGTSGCDVSEPITIAAIFSPSLSCLLVYSFLILDLPPTPKKVRNPQHLS